MTTDSKVGKHTPGPWKVITRSNQTGVRCVIVVDRNNRHVITFNEPTPEQIALAALIAAAPEMLEALEEVELRCTQARLASGIGKESATKRVEFLIGELQRIAAVARAAINKGE